MKNMTFTTVLLCILFMPFFISSCTDKIDDHYIMFIETISEDKNHVQLQYLHPGEEPKMLLQQKLGKTLAREFCNLHGLWEGESD